MVACRRDSSRRFVLIGPYEPAAVISGTPTSANSTTTPIRFTVRVSDAVNPFPGGPTKALAIKVNKR